MNEESNQVRQLGGDASESVEKRLTISEAAQALGVDSFTVFTFIRTGRVTSTRSSSGEITLPESEVAKLIGGRGEVHAQA
jgi:predicted site-specific integrase-resolvase